MFVERLWKNVYFKVVRCVFSQFSRQAIRKLFAYHNTRSLFASLRGTSSHRSCSSSQHQILPCGRADFVYSLRRALNQVDKLKGRGDQAIAIDRIKCAALTCKYPLEQFLAKIQKYEKSLGLGKSVAKVRDAGRKIQYALGRRDEANMLRNYLNLHIGTINMLMLQEGLERLDVASEKSEKNQEETKDGIKVCSRELKGVKGSVEAQVLAVRENNSILQKLFCMVSGEIAAPLKTLSQTVAKVW